MVDEVKHEGFRPIKDIFADKTSEARLSEPIPELYESVENDDTNAPKLEDAKKEEDAFDHLPEHERRIVEMQLDWPPVDVSFRTLFRYATWNDVFIIIISSICALAGGTALPLLTVRRKESCPVPREC